MGASDLSMIPWPAERVIPKPDWLPPAGTKVISADDQAVYGLVEDDVVRRLDGLPFETLTPGERVGPVDQVQLLAPCQPTKIVAIGRNYAEHVREMGGEPDLTPPVFFGKPSDAVLADGGDFPYPPASRNVQPEVELVVAIGRYRFQPPRAWWIFPPRWRRKPCGNRAFRPERTGDDRRNARPHRAG